MAHRDNPIELTADYVRLALDYDALTGIFIWRSRADMPPKWNTKWAGKRAGTAGATGYRYIEVGKNGPMGEHRLAWLHFHGEWPKASLDHKNGLRDDNRIENLREVGHSENSANKRMQRNNTSGFVGVVAHGNTGKWRARVTFRRTTHEVGVFDTPQEAAQARAKRLKEIQGEFANHDPHRPGYFHYRDG